MGRVKARIECMPVIRIFNRVYPLSQNRQYLISDSSISGVDSTDAPELQPRAPADIVEK